MSTEVEINKNTASPYANTPIVNANVRFTEVDGQRKIVMREVGKVNDSALYAAVKRIIDILISVVGLILFLIPMLIISVLVKLDSEGPVFYSQERVGRNGRKFMIYKFRSMVNDAEKDGAKWADRRDERVTKIGSVLRKTHLDELPQFWNILNGSMSLVGPRPEREVFYKKFAEYIIGFDQRLLVKPGLTGWAQVNGGYELLPEEKAAWDIDYIENQSVWLDIKCILKTSTIIFGDEKTR
ncbi:MAG: sugar transferase [Clostridia bacterium]|nr:sugar transferase [Clostridia bacterium]